MVLKRKVGKTMNNKCKECDRRSLIKTLEEMDAFLDVLDGAWGEHTDYVRGLVNSPGALIRGIVLELKELERELCPGQEEE